MLFNERLYWRLWKAVRTFVDRVHLVFSAWEYKWLYHFMCSRWKRIFEHFSTYDPSLDSIHVCKKRVKKPYRRYSLCHLLNTVNSYLASYNKDTWSQKALVKKLHITNGLFQIYICIIYHFINKLSAKKWNTPKDLDTMSAYKYSLLLEINHCIEQMALK